MKFIVLFILLIPVAFAAGRKTRVASPAATPNQNAASTASIQTAVSTLSNPQSISPQVDCAEAIASGSPLPAYCQDLFTSVCNIHTTENNLALLSGTIETNTYGLLPPNATQAQRNQAAADAISRSDVLAYDNNSQQGLSRDDVRRLMDPARWNVVSLFNGVGFPSADRQRRLASIVQNVHLKSGTEYVNSLIQWGRQQNPSASMDVLRRDAINTYTAACGRTGLEVNAFFEDGDVILCPGLAYSMRDYGSQNKIEEIKAAMIFTMSHEITHSIDYLTSQNDYSELVTCYRSYAPDASLTNTHILAELTSDYYGAFAMGKYISENALKLGLPTPATPESANTVLRILARSVGSYCQQIPGDTEHPQGSYRLNQVLARTPSIKAALGCPAPTLENPGCSLRGPTPPFPVR